MGTFLAVVLDWTTRRQTQKEYKNELFHRKSLELTVRTPETVLGSGIRTRKSL